jgi:3-hydroxyisobutyrate dehydrogenase-like beta-hydroxyacid dehydrogenase
LKVGFIGLGRMGAAMAWNIQTGGHVLFVNDIRRDACNRIVEAGATFLDTASLVVRQSEIVLISVPGPDELEVVMSGPDGLLAGIERGMVVIDTTTVSPDQSKENAERCRERGADYLDAPVSGGQHGAISADLAAMVGGERPSFERALPILECVAKSVTHIGPVGSGSAIKLLNQLIYVSYQMVFAEGLAIGEDLGLDLDTMLDVWGASAAGHPMITTKYDEIRGVADTPGFAVNRALLFIDLADDACKDLGYLTPVFDAVAASLRRAEADGFANEDMILARNRYRKNADDNRGDR